MYKNKGVNVLTVFLAVILSIFLVVLCAVIPVYTSAVGMIKPQNVKALIQEIDYVELFETSPDANRIINEFGLGGEEVDALVKSEVAEELIELYEEDIENVMEGDNEPSAVTARSVRKIFRDNIDEIVDISMENGNRNKERSELKAKILEAIDNNAAEIADAFPDVNEMVKNGDLQDYLFFIKPVMTFILIAFALLLAGLIYVCRMKRFRALIWFAIDLGIAAVPLLVAVIALYAGVAQTVMAEESALVNALISVLAGNILIGLIIILVLMAACIVGYILLKKYVVKPAPAQMFVSAEGAFMDEAPIEPTQPEELSTMESPLEEAAQQATESEKAEENAK